MFILQHRLIINNHTNFILFFYLKFNQNFTLTSFVLLVDLTIH